MGLAAGVPPRCRKHCHGNPDGEDAAQSPSQIERRVEEGGIKEEQTLCEATPFPHLWLACQAGLQGRKEIPGSFLQRQQCYS